MNFINVGFLVLLAAASSLAAAQKTYTPAELRRMVDSGNYPKQASPSTKTESVDYSSCVAKVTSVIDSVQPNYPTRTIVSTSVMRVEKLWTNDSAMTLSCSALDKKLIITTAPYQ